MYIELNRMGPKETLEGNPGRRRECRLRNRHLDDVQVDLIKMGVMRWRAKAIDRGMEDNMCSGQGF
jgi:hypothetical protein